MIMLTTYWSEAKGYGTNPGRNSSMAIMYALIAEHVFSYLFGIFREYDLKHNGQKNKLGLEQAPRETLLRYIEICTDLAISIWILAVMFSQSNEKFNSLPFLNFWIMVDMIIMITTLPYTFMSKFMMINGELTKNIFTLYQVQKRKLKERREAMKQDKVDNWKTYFEDQEARENEEDRFKMQKRVKSMMLDIGKSIDEMILKKMKR